jgi:HK97 family phage prohead protease
MRIKKAPVNVKATGTENDDGTFEAIVATWDLDSYGDKIVKGAFADTLADWKDRGDPIPVIWSHMSFDPDMHLGTVEEAEERDEGLWVRGRLDLEQPKAAQVYRLLKGRRVTQFSFAFDVLEGSYVTKADEDEHDDGYYELRKLKLYEVGPCLIGVNQQTELLAVKSSDGRDLRVLLDGYAVDGRAAPEEAETIRRAVSAALGMKAGRVLSAKNETTLREAVESIDAGRKAINAVLAALANDDGKSTDPGSNEPVRSTDDKARPDAPPADDEDPTRGKSDPPAALRSAADVRLLSDLRAFELTAIGSE